jgi:hypothetical protein
LDAARGAFLVPGFQGHWVGVLMFAATLVGAAMLWSCLPMALSVLRGGETGAADGRTAATFLALYAAMALDKKARGSAIRFVVLHSLGNCGRLESVTEEQLKSAYEKVLS